MPKPICVPCQGFYRPEKNGFYWQENMPTGAEADIESQPASKRRGWQPYKVWVADKWKCPGCGHEIIVGHAQAPCAEHYQPDFPAWTAFAQLQVNDC